MNPFSHNRRRLSPDHAPGNGDPAQTVPDRERALDLLAQRATEGLSPLEQHELDDLLLASPDVSPEGFELAAAGAMLAFLDAEQASEREEMPGHLRDRLRNIASGRIAASGASPGLRLVGEVLNDRRRTVGFAKLGWLAAAAAAALAALAWWPPLIGSSSASLSAQLAAFTSQAPDAVHRRWAGKQPGFENVKGEVVWSDRLQRGFMLLAGLPANDPARKQYQLWIVDPARDQHPVDGGVFDLTAADPSRITSSGETIVPIECKLPVHDPAAFALTVEQPGGVVVSAGPLVVVATR